MAKSGYFMYQRWDNTPVGVYGTKNLAQQAAVDGEYVIVPFVANETYVDLMDESMPEAVIFTAHGYNARINTNAADIANLDTKVVNLSTQFQTFKTQAQNAVANINTELTDHEARISALEPPST